MGYSLLAALATITGRLLTSDPSDLAFYDRLKSWREQFEKVLNWPSAFSSYQRVHSEMLGGGHSDAYYPIGSASERFMIIYDGGGSRTGELVYQRRQGGKAIDAWSVPLVEGKQRGRVKGTLPRFLNSFDMRVSPRAKLTPAMRRKLQDGRYFASYSYHPMNGGFAKVVKPDGTTTPTIRGDDGFWITLEERVLLKRLNLIRP